MKFEYELLEILERRVDVEYYFNNKLVGRSLLQAINFLGKDGWELVGEIDGKIILKRKYDDGEE